MILEFAEAWGSFLLLLIGVGILLSAIFLAIGTKALKIKDSGPVRITITAILTTLLIYFVTALCVMSPNLDTKLGFFFGLILTLFVIKFSFKTKLKRSIILWGFNLVGQGVAVIIAASLLIGGIKDLIEIL